MPASASACPSRVLLKPFLRLIGVRRTSATTSIRLSRREATNDSMSLPAFIASGPEPRTDLGLPEELIEGDLKCPGDRSDGEETWLDRSLALQPGQRSYGDAGFLGEPLPRPPPGLPHRSHVLLLHAHSDGRRHIVNESSAVTNRGQKCRDVGGSLYEAGDEPGRVNQVWGQPARSSSAGPVPPVTACRRTSPVST